jgi:hypothetical protein
MKTDELTGAALDWAVAKCEGLWYRRGHGLARCRRRGRVLLTVN